MIWKPNDMNSDQADHKGCAAVDHVEEKNGDDVEVEDGPETRANEQVEDESPVCDEAK